MKMDCAYQEKRLDKKQKLHSGIKKVNISGAWKRGIGIVNMPMSVNYVFAVYNCKQQEKYPEEYVCQRTAVNSFKREVLSPHSGIVQFAFSDYYDVEKYKPATLSISFCGKLYSFLTIPLYLSKEQSSEP